jgi:bleomycin hydrolase
MKKVFLLFSILFWLSFPEIQAQEVTKENSGYQFSMVKELKGSPVKNQYRSGTCWSFSAISFFESELIRLGKGEFDLSEMFVVRNTYVDKAMRYVRFHGKINFSGGGAFHDAINVMRDYGMLPESIYDGKNIGESNHIHGEMDAVMQGIVDAVIKNKNKKLSPVWHKAFVAALDEYMGPYPDNFQVNGKTYTARTYADELLGLKLDDYVEITSFSHHPFYEEFILEVPDNWTMEKSYNVPLNELTEIIDYAVENGYSVAWACDVSEKGFSWNDGIAIVPEKDYEDLSDLERAKWSELSPAEKDKLLYHHMSPGKEKEITQEIRQAGFDDYSTQDDHGMHILGIAKDQNGSKYYYVKNSWGTDNNPYKGYLYASESFVKYKTTDIMIHKDAIPKKIAKKLGIK